MPRLKVKLLRIGIKIYVSGTIEWPYLRPWGLSISGIPFGHRKQAFFLPHLGLTGRSSGRKYIPYGGRSSPFLRPIDPYKEFDRIENFTFSAHGNHCHIGGPRGRRDTLRSGGPLDGWMGDVRNEQV
jgi:hypothetical protein